MADQRPKLVVITGPTASGKSSLAVDLALELGGELINADSMQVYRGMDIGTAKPTLEERKGIRHHLIDVVDPDEEFNSSIYRSLAAPLIEEIHKKNRVCFLVGGTGLYIKTLLGGLLRCPPADPEIRQRLSREWEELGPASLHEKLDRLDPESGLSIHPNDRTRVLRALEIMTLTGKPFSSLVQEHDFREKSFQSLKICLDLERGRLYQRINERSISMIESGLIEETRTLLQRGYSPELRPMKALGYRHAVEFLKGDRGLDETIKGIQRDTRRYSKRQMTWFRADPEMIRADPGDRDFIKRKVKEFI